MDWKDGCTSENGKNGCDVYETLSEGVSMVSNIKQFTVICKNCGSENVDLSGHCSQNTGFGYLNCMDCNEEEEISSQ